MPVNGNARLLRDPRLAPLLAGVVALTARLLGIATRPLWYDEAFSVLFAEKGLPAMLVGTLSANAGGAAEEHPLAYYALLWAWMRAFGESLVSVRLLSVLAGVLLVLVVYFLARTVFSTSVGLAAALIAALSPFQVHFAQEIRMYDFLALWLALATYAYWRGSRAAGWGWWIAFSIFAALAQYTHSLAAFYLAALALWPLLTRNGRAALRVFVAGCGALLLYAPWLIHLPAQFAKVGQSYWIEKPAPYRLLTLLLTYVTNLPLPGWWLVAGLFVSLAVVAIAILQTIRAVRSKYPQAQDVVWLLYLAFIPPALLFLFSQWKPLYLERALLPSGSMFCIWLAWALTSSQLRRPIQVLLSALLLAASGMGIYQHLSYTGFPYAPYQAMLTSINTQRQTGDVVIHSSKLSMLPSVYYDRSLPQSYVADTPGSSVDTLALSTQRVLGLLAQPDVATASSGAHRVWFIIFQESITEYKSAGYPTHPQLDWLMNHYALLGVQNWGDLRLYQFSSAP